MLIRTRKARKVLAGSVVPVESLEIRRLLSNTTFTLVPAQSSLTLAITVTYDGIQEKVTNQGTSTLNSAQTSLETELSGSLQVAVGSNSIQFSSGSVAALNNGSWQPGDTPDGASSNYNAKVAAEFGGKVTAIIYTDYLAFRGLTLDGNSPVLTASGGTYTTNSLLNLDVTAGDIYYDGTIPSLYGEDDLTGNTGTDQSASGATLTTSGSTQTLTVPIDVTYDTSISSSASATSNLVGTIVATATLPTGPTITMAAKSSSNPVQAKTTTLSVLGSETGVAASSLSYNWATAGTPPAAVVFSNNNDNAASSVTATFSAAGSYSFIATVTDPSNQTVTSSVTVSVISTVTTITVTPAAPIVMTGATQQFSATYADQFGNSLGETPAWTTTGGGSISSSGLFSATTAGGPFTVTAAVGSVSGTASVTVLQSAPSYYLRLDADHLHVDVYDNSTGTGTVAQQLLFSQLSSIALTTTGGSGSITLNNSAGNIIPAGGANLTGDGSTTLLLVGSGAGDTVTQNSSQIVYNGLPLNFSNISQTTLNPNGGTDNLTVNAGKLLLSAPPAGDGILVRSFSNISIAANAQLQVLSPASQSDRALLVVNKLTIAGATGNWTGLLDLGGSDLDLQTGSLATVSNMAAAGYNFGVGSFQAEGITSSLATSDTTHLTVLGVIANNQGGTAIYGTGMGQSLFDGTAPGASDLLIKFTYFGDANLDGKVNGSDYSRIDNAFGSGLTGWFNGDFNYDGAINGTDYTLIDNAFNKQSTPLAAAVATPAVQIFHASSVAATSPVVFQSQTPIVFNVATASEPDLMLQKKDLLDLLAS